MLAGTRARKLPLFPRKRKSQEGASGKVAFKTQLSMQLDGAPAQTSKSRIVYVFVMKCNVNHICNQTTVNWAQLSNRGYVDTDMLTGSYPHRKYMVCMLRNRCHRCGTSGDDDDEQLKIELLSQWQLEAESRNCRYVFAIIAVGALSTTALVVAVQISIVYQVKATPPQID